MKYLIPLLLVAALASPPACSNDGSSADDDADTGADSDSDTDTDTDTGDNPYPNIAIIGVPESLQDNGDGTYSITNGEELYEAGFEFYETHDDLYDVLAIFADFDVVNTFAFSIPLDHEIEGIGLQEVMELYGWGNLSPATAGSDGQLQHIMLMNSKDTYVSDFWDAQDILTHELGHRWSANLSLSFATDPWVIVDAFYAHWNVHANVGGPSTVGYGELIDLGGDQFSFVLEDDLVYSELELYQQGLIPPEEVGELFYVIDPYGYDPPDQWGEPWTNDSYGSAVSFLGTRVDFTIDDVIADHGPRVPSHADAQTDFRMAFVLACVDVNGCSSESLVWVEQQRVDFEGRFDLATGGRATMDTTL